MIEYTIKKSIRTKNIYLRITKDGKVVVSGGLFLTKKVAEKLIKEKESWIISKINELKQKGSNKQNLTFAKQMCFCGKLIDINVIIDETLKKVVFNLKEDKLEIHSSKALNEEEIIFYRDEFYRIKAKEILPEMINYFAFKMKLKPNGISFRKSKTRWGSCSFKNNLSMSVYLMALPVVLIENVVVHELAHIVHKNHSSDFWNLVKEYRPNFDEEKKALKTASKFV